MSSGRGIQPAQLTVHSPCFDDPLHAYDNIYRIMIKVIALLLVTLPLMNCASMAWNKIETGKVTPVTIFSGNYSSSTYTYSIAHGLGTASFQVCLALISYNAILSTTFAFNTTVLSKTTTDLSFSVQTYSSTYFNILSYHYLITNHATLEISLLCYYTSVLFSGTGARAVIENNASTALTGDFLTVTSVLTGFKIENSQGTELVISVSSTLSGGVISTTIATDNSCLVEWACLAIIVYNPKSVVSITGEFYLKQTATVDATVGLGNCITMNPAFTIANTKFFGLSKMVLNLNNAIEHIFIMNTDNVVDPMITPTINANQVQLSLEQLFIWYDVCIGTPGNVVPLVVGYTCAAACNPEEYDSNTYCVSCGNQGGNCLTCDSTQCVTCDASGPTFRVLDTTPVLNVCACLPTYFQASGVCVLCSDHLPNCLDCSSASVCTTCNVTFVPSLGICVCTPGTYLINSECIPLMGCLDYSGVINAYYCNSCDTANYFQPATNLTCQCMSNTIYNSVTGMCEGNCSDGVAVGNLCDLGVLNGVAGSGCETNCTVMAGFTCTNPDTTAASICVEDATYNASFMFVTKDLNSNTAHIYLTLSPADAILGEMNFSTLVTTSIPTSAITCTYDSSTGILLVKATYTESIEGTSQYLTIAFDQTKRAVPSVELSAAMAGVNSKLQFSSFQTYNSIIYYMSMMVGGASFIFAIVSGLVGFKMIGLELCLPIQVTYLTLCYLNVPYSSLSSLYGLNLSTGYNQISSFELLNYLNLDKGLIVLQRNNFFLENCNFTYVSLAILLLLSVLTYQCVKEKVEEPKTITERKKKKEKEQKHKKDKMEMDKDKMEKDKKEKDKKEKMEEMEEENQRLPKECSKGQKAHYFIVDKLLVNFWVMLLLLSVFSFGIQIQTQEYNSKYSFNFNVGMAMIVLVVQLGGLMFVILKIKEKDKNVSFRSHSKYYPIIYILCHLVSVIFIVCTYFVTKYAIFLILVPEIVLLVFFVKLSPHGKFKSFVNITGFYLQCLPLLASSLFIGVEYLNVSILATVSAFAIIVLFLIGQGLSIARLVIKYREDQSRIKERVFAQKVKLETENLEAMTYSSIKNQLMNNTERKMMWGGEEMQDYNGEKGESRQPPPLTPSRIASQYQQMNSHQEEEDSEEKMEEGEENELKRVKMRLKKELAGKRSFI